MKIIFSYTNFLGGNYLDYKMVSISNNLAKRLGYKTVLFTDKNNISKFENIKYDEIVLIDNSILEKFPRNVWSLGKILVFSLIKEPFCHIDFDVFLLEAASLKKIENQDFFCFHKEPWRPTQHFNPFYKQGVFNLKINEDRYMHTYNCALVGGKAIKEINESAEIVLNYASENKTFFESKYRQIPNWTLAVLFEQIFFVNICRQKLNMLQLPLILDIKTDNILEMEQRIFDQMLNQKVMHLWGLKKDTMSKIEELIKLRKIN